MQKVHIIQYVKNQQILHFFLHICIDEQKTALSGMKNSFYIKTGGIQKMSEALVEQMVSDFKTKSEIITGKLPRISGNNQHNKKCVIALDGGYSAVKGASDRRLFIYPSYAKKIDHELEIVGAAGTTDTDIQYRNNKTGELWIIGKSAQTLMGSDDLDATTDASIYTRYRYDSDMYKALMATGLALGFLGNDEDTEVYLQTGLPATYKDRDENKLIEALCDDYDISIKLGNKPWERVKINLTKDHIFVMEQPKGTLCSLVYTADGIVTSGKDILSSNTLILDIGFGTEDVYSIKSGFKNVQKTYKDTGMKSVFEETIKEIKAKTDDAVETKIFELQKYLTDGELRYFNQESFEVKTIPFSDILFEKNRLLCEKSIKRLMQDYDNLIDYKYLIVTGGTGECRFNQIKDMLKGLPYLTILPGNMNHTRLSFSYSNVLGYYFFRYAKLKHMA